MIMQSRLELYMDAERALSTALSMHGNIERHTLVYYGFLVIALDQGV